MSTLRCAMCPNELAPVRHDDVEASTCPTGHGLAITPSAATSEALAWLRERASSRAPGIRHCPRCESAMAVVQVDGDQPVKADICLACGVAWFDSLEIVGLPVDQPEAEADDLVARAAPYLRTPERV